MGVLLQNHWLHSNEVASLLLATIEFVQLVFNVAHLLGGSDGCSCLMVIVVVSGQIVRRVDSVQFGWSH